MEAKHASKKEGADEKFEMVSKSEDEIEVCEIEAKDAPIKAVTVFKDRAEVIREIEAKLIPGSTQEIIVKGLSDKVATDSIRVNGEGQFTIHEVQYDKKWVLPPAGDKKGTTAKLNDLKKEESKLRMTLQRIAKERNLIETYANTVTSFRGGSSKEGGSSPFADLKTVQSTFEFYQKQSESLDDRQRNVTERLAELSKQLILLRDEERRLANRNARGFYRHDVHVIIQSSEVEAKQAENKEADETEPIKLFLIYTVQDATWNPSYDCRVESKTDKMTFVYYGLVTQQTGEDWKNVQIRLSTATPAVGGKPPSIPTKYVTWKQITPAPVYLQKEVMRQAKGRRRENYFNRAMNIQQNFLQENDEVLEDAEEKLPVPAAKLATASVKQGFATQFLIKRPANILSGRKPHKTCIGVVPLSKKSMFYGVPSLAPRAYYQARAKNTSPYPFLPSAEVRCFFDGNYVCNTEIKEVISPGEFFSTFVGVDDAIKLTYKLIKGADRNEGGLLTSKKNVTEHKSITTIKNNKKTPIRISIAQQLPKALNDQIKVDLLEPRNHELEEHNEAGDAVNAEDAVEGQTRIKFNKVTNNVVWLVTVQPGESKTVPFSFEVRYPSGRQISIQ